MHLSSTIAFLWKTKCFVFFHKAELEFNLSAIEIQQRDQYETQSQELDFLHASIMEMVVSIEEMQRK